MKEFLFILFAISSVTVSGQLIKEHYADGNVRAEGYMQSGKKDGLWKYFFPDGTLNAEEEYEEGELNGRVLSYDFSGKLIARENWKSGVITDSAWYYKEGYLWRKGKYDHGVYQGQWIFYHPSGQVQQIGFYDKGLPDGIWKTFDTDGNLLEEGEYQNGSPSGLWKFYNKGALAMYGHYKEGVQVGEWFRVLKNGKERKMKY